MQQFRWIKVEIETIKTCNSCFFCLLVCHLFIVENEREKKIISASFYPNEFEILLNITTKCHHNMQL